MLKRQHFLEIPGNINSTIWYTNLPSTFHSHFTYVVLTSPLTIHRGILLLPYFPWKVYQLMGFWLQKDPLFFFPFHVCISNLILSLTLFFHLFFLLLVWFSESISSPTWRNKVSLLITQNIQENTTWKDTIKQTLSLCECLRKILYLYLSWRIKCCDFCEGKQRILRILSALQL